MHLTKAEATGKYLKLVAVALFFCLLPIAFSFAASPTITSISPTSGTSTPDTLVKFTCTYSDADGWANFKEAYLLVSTSSSALTNSCYAYYDQNANLLYLRNDANTAWLGGYAPGFANTIENSYVKLTCASTTVSGTATTLTVGFAFNFKTTYSGKRYNAYLSAKDDNANSVALTNKGSCTINRTPALGTVTPASGTTAPNSTVSFTSTYTDADGYANIRYAYILINTSVNGLNSLYAQYDRPNNKLYLRNDANTAWTGGYAPGSANTIENSFAKLNCASTTASATATTLTVTWNITLKSSFAGSKNTYLYVTDSASVSYGWTQKGTYTITNTAPTLGSLAPTTGTIYYNQPKTFTATYSDPNGYLNIRYARLIVNASASGLNGAYVYYDRPYNKLYLRNDANTSWLGGYAPGSSNTIENTYCRLNCASTTASGSGNNLTFNWNLTFKSAFTGTKYTYIYVTDLGSLNAGWAQKGTHTFASDTTPPTGTISINAGKYSTNSTTATLTLTASDTQSGMSTGAQMQFSNDNITFSAAENYSTSKTWSLTTGQGTKTVYAKVKDTAGNWSTVFSDTIILDTTAPTLNLTTPPALTNQDITLNYTVTDNYSAANNITITGNNSPYSQEGAFNIALTATDQAGNATTKTSSFTIDKTPPNVIITQPTEGQVLETTSVTLQGTIDGVAFSETRTLINGDNALTKTATDSAGNSTTATVHVYSYLGTTIGPAGGIVTSPDGTVTVTIPAGALTTNTQIKVLNLDNDVYQPKTPTGGILLSAVDCKPSGLTFASGKPATITYKFTSAQIPGTVIELGLYNTSTGKIEPTGQKGTIQADSYSVSFSLQHFSINAAYIPATTSAPIGAGVKIPLPDLLTGSFSHAIPLTVPPGRKGLQPSLALTYRSSNPNSWIGVGFSLNSGYIVRSTKLGVPKYNDTQDTFYLVTDGGTTELVNLIDNLYQAKIESSFTKFYKEADDSWRALAKDGSTLYFGSDSNAKESGSNGTFSWYLSKAKDTNSNYITYSYTQNMNKSYLARIDYTGNEAMGVSPKNYVTFTLETRSDDTLSFISGKRAEMSYRLKTVEAYTDSTLVWRYELEYTYSTDTDRSMLVGVTQYSSDNKALPKQTLQYQRAK